jgi:hypothetical protein
MNSNLAELFWTWTGTQRHATLSDMVNSFDRRIMRQCVLGNALHNCLDSLQLCCHPSF